jgi:hypothetical protein
MPFTAADASFVQARMPSNQEVSSARQQMAIHEMLSRQQQSGMVGGMMGAGGNSSNLFQHGNLQQLLSLQNHAAFAAPSSGMQGDNRSARGFSSMFGGGSLGNAVQQSTTMQQQSQLAACLRQAFPPSNPQLLQQGLGMPPQLIQGHGGFLSGQQGISGGQSQIPGRGGSPHIQSLLDNNVTFPAPPGSDFGVGRGREQSQAIVEENLKLTGRDPITLYMTCDEESLSEYQCLVRRQVDIFEARREEVDSNAKGRNKPIVLGQVGIRCRHCSMLPPKHRTRGAMYYPAKLNGLYQAAQSMASGHLCYHCQHIPNEIRQDLLILRERKSSAGGGKKYWADGVRELSVYEDEEGLRFKKR